MDESSAVFWLVDESGKEIGYDPHFKSSKHSWFWAVKQDVYDIYYTWELERKGEPKTLEGFWGSFARDVIKDHPKKDSLMATFFIHVLSKDPPQMTISAIYEEVDTP